MLVSVKTEGALWEKSGKGHEDFYSVDGVLFRHT